ncbi:MAG: lysophospholipid acyltransferase family protein [Nitrospirota bacterium]|nr:lysophospholipid acyltransferase family protein [Nitrospirota bacterium]
MSTPIRGMLYRIFDWLNRLICHILYSIRPPSGSPLPESGPVLLVSDHSAYSDPMVLAATAGRPIVFLTAREIYYHPFLVWFCKTVRYIPVRRDIQDVGAVRAMLRALSKGEVVALFPEGGINEYREEGGHLGIGYLALKTAAPVVPASIAWDKASPLSLPRSLCTPRKATVRYGAPIVFPTLTHPDRENIEQATARIMYAIRTLRDSQTSTPC